MSYTNIRLPSDQRVSARRLPPGPPLFIEPEPRTLRFYVGRAAEIVIAIVVVLLIFALVTP